MEQTQDQIKKLKFRMAVLTMKGLLNSGNKTRLKEIKGRIVAVTSQLEMANKVLQNRKQREGSL